MLRFHKKIYFPDIEKLKNVNNNLNMRKWQYSKHALENLKYRSIDIKKALNFIKNVELDYLNIFEYYKLDGSIEKVCYRIEYNQLLDIILVVNKYKKIITVYMNSKDDKHFTLKSNLYCSCS